MAWFYQLAALRIAEPLPTANVSSPAKMEGGMCVDLHKRDTSRNRLLLTGEAIVPMLMILTTSVSCSRRAAEMPEPPFRILERILPFYARTIPWVLADGRSTGALGREAWLPLAPWSLH